MSPKIRVRAHKGAQSSVLFVRNPGFPGHGSIRSSHQAWCKHRRHHPACPCCEDKWSQKHRRETTERDQGKPRLRLAVFRAAIGSHLG